MSLSDELKSLTHEELIELELSLERKKKEKRRLELAKHGKIDLKIYEPFEKQLIFHTSTHSIRCVCGGNSSGKTYCGSAEALWRATKTHPYNESANQRIGPQRGVIVVNDHKQQKLPGGAQSKLISMMNEDYVEKIVYNKYQSIDTIYLKDGGSITFKSSMAGKKALQGGRLDWIWVDEDAIPNASYWRELWTRVPENGSGLYVWFTFTPGLKEDGESFLVEEILPRANKIESIIRLWEISIYDNPHMDDHTKETMVGGMFGSDDDEVNARIYGSWQVVKGLIYDSFSNATHVLPRLKPEEIKNFKSIYRIIDPHPAKNIAVCYAGITHNEKTIIFDEIWQKGLVSQIAELMRRKSSGTGHLIRKTIIDYQANAGDKITGKSVTQEFADHGISTVPCKKDVFSGINDVKKLLFYDPVKGISPKLYVTVNCSKTIEEFKKYRWDPKNARKPKKDHDEFMDCIRYLVADNTFIKDFLRNVNINTPDLFDNDNFNCKINNNLKNSTQKKHRIKRNQELLGYGVGR